MAECYCHANGCDEPHRRPGPPFCDYHWNMLPVPHRKAIADAKWKVEECPWCFDPKVAGKWVKDGRWPGGPRWYELVNLAIAQICMAEYGPHGCPESLLDAQGFCWGCGCSDVPRVYDVAKKALDRHGWPVREVPT